MTEPSSEARIRDLRKRVEREPGSRYFVPLAEEYRRAGRLAEAIATLEEGLVAHPGYVAAQVALARAYLEAGQIGESMASFSKALAADPSNLVAAKALADLHLSRGEPVEALKRYRLYRGISGDRKLDLLIEKLERDLAPRVSAAPPPPELPPPPPSFRQTPAYPLMSPPWEAGADRQRGEAQGTPEAASSAGAAAPAGDPHDITSIPYKRPSRPVPVGAEPFDVPSRDVSLAPLAGRPRDEEEIITRKIRLPEAMWPFEEATPAEPPPSPEAPPPALSAPEPKGRALADLYFEQGHYAEAERAYRELLAGEPDDPELRRLLGQARERLSGAVAPAADASRDSGRERRLARIRVLKEWLRVLQTEARNRGSGTGSRETPSGTP